jgi:ribonuclease P protein component
VGTAVVRNRVRRRLRASLERLDREGLVPAGRYLIIVAPEAATTTFSELDGHLTRLMAKVA